MLSYFLATWIILPVLFGTKVLGEGTPVRARAATSVVVPAVELRRVETPTDGNAGGGAWEVTGVSKASVFEAEPALRVVVALAGGEATELVVFLAVVFLAVVFLATVDLALGVILLLAGAVALEVAATVEELATTTEASAGVDLDGVDLDGVDLDGVDLDGVDLDGVDLDGVDLDLALGLGLGFATTAGPFFVGWGDGSLKSSTLTIHAFRFFDALPLV